jgi:hypothetical protein
VAACVGIAAAANNACQQSSLDEQVSCQLGAQSDLSLAIGMCENVSDPGQQSSCKQQAQTNYSDALKTCGVQGADRQSLCQKLGGQAYDPVIDPANFTTNINNPYSPLVPGTTYIYQVQSDQGMERDTIAVTHNTKVIDGVTCIEVHDVVSLNGVATEDTLDYFAQDLAGNVWYFGENSEEMSNGRVISVEGSWMAGVDGAKPGILMEAHPKVGDVYREEFFMGTAEDWSRVLALRQTVTVPAGTFTNCLKTEDASTLEPGMPEDKFYAPGVGFVKSIDLDTGFATELVQILTGQ